MIFPNGDTALISADSDLDAIICEKLTGAPVFNPYRDVRISFSELLSYRRGVFSDNTIRLLTCTNAKKVELSPHFTN